MMYEISKEVFKQRLDKSKRLNFKIIDISQSPSHDLKDIENIAYTEGQFASSVESAVGGDKDVNIIVFTLEKGNSVPAKAAEDLSNAGFSFVYYYRGEPEDAILDKGLN
ncbi:MAG: hypothetical protein H6621_10410 [Halobacteriovoraceae bacterium]|nr:hypothetical protein [Halobacteriovoraceae bacterium]MCB9095468.1 hypothetical protein [Halobacteriovoraceae bacterium]